MIREASCSSQWEQMQKPTARYYFERVYMGVSHQIPRLGAQGIHETERLKEPVGTENTRITRSYELTKQGAYKLTETESASTGPTWICTRSDVLIL